MAIEIKQLVIRAVVEQPRNIVAPPTRTELRETTTRAPVLANGELDREELVGEITRLVLRELRRERAR